MKKNIRYTLSALLFASLTLTFVGCKKDKPTTVKIIVRDANNALVIGASVVIDANPDTSVDPGSINTNKTYKAQITDYKGEATFDYSDIYKAGSAGVAILDVEATYGSSSVGQTGTGVVKIEPETETVQTIYIQ